MTPYYDHGGITIYHGDCRWILPKIAHADLLLTDPPYGINFTASTWDDDPQKYPQLMTMLVNESNRIVRTGGFVFIFQAMLNCPRFHEWFPNDFRIFAAIKNFARIMPTRVRHSWDPVVFWCNGKPDKPEKGKVNRDWHIGNIAGVIRRNRNHPCPKPIDTIKYIIDIASYPGEVVLDPFMGSGTTLRAAKDLGRRAIGIEIEERYCEIAANRLAQEVLFV